jgi:hypothetical protein
MQDQLTFPGNEATHFRGWNRLLSSATMNKLLSSDEISSIDYLVRGLDCSRRITPVLRAFVSVLFVCNLAFFPGIARAQRNLNSQSELSSRDWQGSWDLQFEYAGQWHSSHLVMTASEAGIQGDYDSGRLRGTFDRDDVSIATGQTENTTATGRTCASGKQTGAFSLTLAADGKSMNGWWDVCNTGPKYRWKAQRQD